MTNVISFRGKARSGKSTAAKYLEETYPFVVRMAFADALKVEVYDFLRAYQGEFRNQIELRFCQETGTETMSTLPFPGGVEGCFSIAEKLAWVDEHKPMLRKLLQWYGTEFRRGQDENYWVDRFVAKATRLISEEGLVIAVDDVRFPNELAAVKKLRCMDIWIENPSVREVEGIPGHVSEALGPEGSDAWLWNDGMGLPAFLSYVQDLFYEAMMGHPPLGQRAL